MVRDLATIPVARCSHSGLGYWPPMTHEAEWEAVLTEPEPAKPITVHENGATL